MDSFLKLPAEQQALLFAQAQQRLGLAPASIEKDFWVCLVLRELFALPVWGAQLTFKGGTSLSKAWKLIHRFSEDIDVVIEREFLGFGGELTKTRQKKLVKTCSERIIRELKPQLEQRFRELLGADSVWSLDLAPIEEDRDRQTLLFQYPITSGKVNYLRPIVKIEMGARSGTEPVESPSIAPYLAEAFPDILGACAFSLRCLSPRRTFWEKAMLLHEETYRPSDKLRRARLARHYYDLYCLIQGGVAVAALEDQELFERVAKHRSQFFAYTWLDYSTLKRGSFRLVPLPEQLLGWRQDYEAMRGEMFMNDPPSFEEILEEVGGFERKFNQGG
jgi:hypothetical protein